MPSSVEELPIPDPSLHTHLPASTLQAKQDVSLCRQEIPLGSGRRAIFELPEDVKPEEIQRLVRILQALAEPIT